MKKIGTKKEVYLGIALKTQSGMTRDDIIKALKEKSKKVYLSKKVYGRIKSDNHLISSKRSNHTKKHWIYCPCRIRIIGIREEVNCIRCFISHQSSFIINNK